MCWLNTDSVNITDIAVLCSSDHLPWKAIRSLYENQIEFNYLETELLKKCVLTSNTLQIENQCYRVILIEDGLPISASAQTVLDRFQANGGQLRFLSDVCDAETLSLLKQCNPSALKPICNPADLCITHVTKANTHFYMMFNESDTPFRFEAPVPVAGRMELWDPWNGTFTDIPDNQKLSIHLNGYESLVLAVKQP
jgi:hypothetical protein